MAKPRPKQASGPDSKSAALAEQLGTIAGTVQGTAEKYLNRRPRAGAQRRGRNTKNARRGQVRMTRVADPARAPGKRRRKPAPTVRGAKKSDERIPKMRTAAAVRRRRKSYA
jgi:hypothetical protein